MDPAKTDGQDVKILVVDDHAVVREGVARILAETGRMKVAGQASDSAEVSRFIREENFDAVLLDITLPGKGGLEVLKEIKRLKPALPVLILSIHDEDQYALRALKAGAAGYLTKQAVPRELVNAIEKVLGGGRYVSPALAEKLALRVQHNLDSAPHEHLSDREFQVMCMIASGKTISQVAEELNLSVQTVSTHRRRLLDKMGMQNNAEITSYAVRNDLV